MVTDCPQSDRHLQVDNMIPENVAIRKLAKGHKSGERLVCVALLSIIGICEIPGQCDSPELNGKVDGYALDVYLRERHNDLT